MQEKKTDESKAAAATGSNAAVEERPSTSGTDRGRADREREPAPPAPLQETIGAVVDKWVIDHIHGSPVARSTEAYNHLKDSLPQLKANLAEALQLE